MLRLRRTLTKLSEMKREIEAVDDRLMKKIRLDSKPTASAAMRSSTYLIFTSLHGASLGSQDVLCHVIFTWFWHGMQYMASQLHASKMA